MPLPVGCFPPRFSVETPYPVEKRRCRQMKGLLIWTLGACIVYGVMCVAMILSDQLHTNKMKKNKTM